MASGIDEPLERLRRDPVDEAALSRLANACLREDDLAGLREGCSLALEALPDERVPAVATELADRLAEVARERSADVAVELLLRAIDLHLLADVDGSVETAAEDVEAAWRRRPDARIVERAWELLGRPSTSEAPDALLRSRARVAPTETRRIVLGMLAERAQNDGRTADARHWLEELRALAPDDLEVKHRLEALRDDEGATTSADLTGSTDAAQRDETPQSPDDGAGRSENTADEGEADASTAPPTEQAASSSEAAPGPTVTRAVAPDPREPGSRSPEERARALREALEGASAERAVLLRRELFDLLRDELDRPDEARAILHAHLEPPEEVADRVRAAAGEAREGSAEDAVRQLDEAAREASDAEAEQALLLEQARILEAELDAPERAEAIHRRLRILAPRSLEPLAFYRSWHLRRGEPHRAHATLAQLHAALHGDELAAERALVAAEMARLAERELDSPDRAIEGWRRVLADEPDHGEAHEALRRLYASTGRWHALAEHLDDLVRRLPEDRVDRKVELLFELIDVYQDPDKLPMEDMVVATYQRIVALRPTEVRALDDLARRYEGHHRWRELVRLLEQRVEVTEDPQELLELFHRIADLYVEHIRSDVEAIPILERVLELDPGNIDVIRRLRTIHRRRRDAERLYETYQRELELLEGPEQLDVLVELARLADESLLRRDEAIGWWQRVLEREPEHREAIEALQRLSAEREDWSGYTELLERQLEGSTSHARRVELLGELGRVAWEQLGDADRAQRLFEEILELEPLHPTARSTLQAIHLHRRDWEALERLYAATGDWRGLVADLRDAARREEDADRRADFLAAVARVEEERLDEPERARRSLLDALEASPERTDLARRLLSQHDERLDDEDRRRALEALAAHAEHDAERGEAHRRLAEVHRRRGDAEAALEARGEALQLAAAEGRTDELDRLAEDAEEAGAPERAGELVRAALARLPHEAADARRDLHRWLGSWYRQRLGDAEAAIPHYRGVLQLAPGDAEALGALEEIHLSQNDFEGLQEVLRARAEQLHDPSESMRALDRLGRLYEDVLADTERAAAVQRERLQRDPADRDALAALRRLLEGRGTKRELAATLQELLARVEDPERACEMRLELARLYGGPLEEPEAAADHLGDLLGRGEAPEPVRRQALEALETLYEEERARERVTVALEAHYRSIGDDEALARILRGRLRQATDRAEVAGVVDELVEILAERLDRPDEAFEVRAEALAHDTSHAAWQALEPLARRAERLVRLAELAGASLDPADDAVPPPPEDAVDALRLDRARWLHDGGDDERARVVWEALARDAEASDTQREALQALLSLHEEHGDHDSAAAAQRDLGRATTEAGERRRRLLDAADRFARQLGRLDEAVTIHAELAAEDPTDDEVAGLLEDACEASGRYDELIAHLGRRAEALPDDAGGDRARLRRALVRQDRGEMEAATGELLELVDRPPVRADARDVLMDLATAPETSATLRERIVEVLDRHFHEEGDVWGRALLRERRAERTAGGTERAPLLLEAAECLAPLDGDEATTPTDDEAAQRALELTALALREDPASDDALEALGRRAMARGAWSDWFDAVAAASEQAADSTRAAGLWAQVARTAEEELDDLDRAIEAWERVLGPDRSTGGPYRAEALRRLDALYGRRGRPEDRAAILALAAERADQPAERLSLLRERAELLEELERPEEAVEALRSLMDETRATRRQDLLAERDRAAERLDELLARLQRDRERLELLIRTGRSHRDDEAAIEQLRRAAELAESSLDDVELAIEAWEALRERGVADAETHEALERLYRRAERWRDLAGVLDERIRAADAEGERERARDLRFTLGQLHEHRLTDRDEAVAAYAAILRDEPDFAPARAALGDLADGSDPAGEEARRALVDAHRRADEPEPLARMLELQLARGDVADDEATVRAELAELYLARLDAPDAAWEHAAAAYRAAEADEAEGAPRDRLVRIALALGDAERVAPLLLEQAERVPDDADRVARLEGDAEALSRAGFDEAAREPLWRAVVDLEPRHASGLAVLDRQARARGDDEDLAHVLRLREEVAEDAATRRELRLERARLLASMSGREDEALACYEGVVDEVPDDEEAFAELGALQERLERWSDRAERLEDRLAAVAGDPGRERPLLGELGRIHAEHLDDAGRAVECWARRLEHDPDDTEALRALEMLWAQGRERRAILERLQQYYERAGDWKRLVALYRTTPGREEFADVEADCLRRAAELSEERLEDPSTAYAITKELAERLEVPDETLDALEERAARVEAWSDLVAFYEHLVEQGRETRSLLTRLAAVAEERLGDRTRAIRYRREALKRAPDDEASREALTKLLAADGRWEELVSHLRSTSEELLDPEARTAALSRAAEVLHRQLGRPAEAATVLQEALEIDPSDDDLADRVATLLREAGDRDALHEHLRAWIGRSEGDTEAELRIRLARSLLEDPDEAEEGLDELAALAREGRARAGVAEALHELLDARLDEASSGAPPREASRALVERAAELLLELSGDEAPPAERARIEAARLRALPEDADRREPLLRVARLQEEAGNPDAAFEHYAEALRLGPDDPDVEERLEALSSEAGDPARLAAVLGELVDAEEPSPVRTRHLRSLANALWRAPDRRDEAAERLEQLLGEHPDDAEVLDRLAQYHEGRGRAREAASVLETGLEQVADASWVSTWRRRLAVLRMDGLDEPAAARELLEAELPDVAGDPDLRARLERLEGADGRFEQLAALYGHALELAERDPEASFTGEERLELLAKRAQIAEQQLGDLETARDACRAILELEPSRGFALRSLARIERARQDWASLDEVLARRLELAETDAERTELHIERARVAADGLQQPERALEHAVRADELTGPGRGSDEVVEVFERLLRQPSTRDEASRRLEPRYESREDWPGVVNVLAMRQAGSTDADERESLALRIASITETRIGDPHAALRALLDAFRQHPERAGLRDAVARAAEGTGDWERTAEAIQGALDRVEDPELVRTLALWLGDVRRRRLEDPAGAAHAYERVLAVDATSTEAAAALNALYRELGRTDELRRLLDARLATATEGERPEVIEELAELTAREKGDPEAIPWWRELLSLRPDHERARARLEELLEEPGAVEAAAEVLEPLLRKQGDKPRLLEVVERRITAATDEPSRARLHVRAARLAEELEEDERALSHYAGAVAADPDDRKALSRLEALAERHGQWTMLADALEQAAVEATGARYVELLRRLARVRAESTDEPERAAEAWQTLLEEEPDDHEALDWLRRHHRDRGETTEALAHVRQLARTASRREDRMAAWREVWELARERSDRGAIEEACRRLLDDDPTDATAAEQLTRTLEESERWRELEQVLRDRAERAPDPKEAARIWARLARLRRGRLADERGALDAWREAWARDPEQDEAFEALRSGYEARGEREALRDLLTRRAESLGDRPEAAPIWVERGSLAETEDPRSSDARRCYRRALDLDERTVEAVDGLIRLARVADDPTELADLLERRARLTEDDEATRLEALAEAAALRMDRLEQPDAAERLAEEVRATRPDHTRARRIVGSALARREEAEAARELLEPLREELAEASEEAARGELAEVLIELGRVYGRQLDRPRDALEVLSEARELAPSRSGLDDAFRELLARTGSWQALEEELERDYERAETDRERCDRALALARLHGDQLGNDEGFRTWIARAEEARRDSPEVAEARVEFHRARGERPEEARYLEWLVNHLQGKRLLSRVPQRAHELARLLEELDRPEDALEYYKMAMQADGTYLPNLLDYGRLLVERERWERALRVHQNLLMQADRFPDEATHLDVLRRLARACHELDRDDQARQYLRRLLDRAPDDEEARKLAERIG